MSNEHSRRLDLLVAALEKLGLDNVCVEVTSGDWGEGTLEVKIRARAVPKTITTTGYGWEAKP